MNTTGMHMTPDKGDRSRTPEKKPEEKPTSEALNEESVAKDELQVPKKRAPGGVWIQADDFPCAFEHLIVYHNMTKFQHTEVYNDVWTDAAVPYISNEKDIYLKLELDDETFDKYKEDNNLDPATTLADVVKGQES